MIFKNILFKVIVIMLATKSLELHGQKSYQPKFLRVFLDNDFINFRGAGTDRYYTNGIRIDYFFSKQQKSKFPTSLLLKISDNENIYGLGLAQFMFTPKHIDVSGIQYGDRPYAGALYGIHSLQSINSTEKIKITSEIFLGVIGPMSFAKETQTWLHNAIDYTKPEGWDNQIANDIILNYNISIEKQLLSPSNKILMVGVVETFSGTLYNAAGIGFMIRIGNFNDYFEENHLTQGHSNKKTRLFVYMNPIARVVLSNAVLEGGLINQLTGKKNIYSLDKDQIERLTLLYDVGLTFERPKFSISLSQKLRTAEFKEQYVQEIGNVTLKYGF